MGRAAVSTCAAFQWRALFSAGFSPALNLLRLSSSLAVGWENIVVAVCGTGRLSSVPQPMPGVLLVSSSFLSCFYFFSLLWFTALFPMPGRYNVIFHTNWRGNGRRRQAGGWRWQSLAPATTPGFCRAALPTGASLLCRLLLEVWGGGKPGGSSFYTGSSSDRAGKGGK